MVEIQVRILPPPPRDELLTELYHPRYGIRSVEVSSYPLPQVLRDSTYLSQPNSGTIGSAMAASLSGIPSIALSFGFMTGHKPPGDAIVQGAILASCKLVSKLWEVGWGSGEDRIGVYSVNVPVSLFEFIWTGFFFFSLSFTCEY